MTIYDICVEYRHEPIGIDVKNPRFSWKINSDLVDTLQESYRIRVMQMTPLNTERGIVWDSGEVISEQSVLVRYEGEELKARTAYRVEITVKDNHGEEACAATSFETGLIHPENMKADWITHAFPDTETACPVFTRRFTSDKKVIRARIYATALGLYEMSLNGKRVGDAYFTPGWTNYHKRLQYQTYDVTDLVTGLAAAEDVAAADVTATSAAADVAAVPAAAADTTEGNCVWTITAADGWYKGPYGVDSTPNIYGDRIAVLAELHLE